MPSDAAMPDVTLDEIRGLLKEMPEGDTNCAAAAAAHQARLTKPEGSLGVLEGLAAWFAAWQGRDPIRLDRPRVAVFAGNHGVAAQGVSAFPSVVTEQMVRNFQDGGAAVNQLCRVNDAELRVYEMALEHPTADFTKGPAMVPEDCARAMAYGMMAVEEGIDVLCLGEMGIGNSTSAAALAHALFGGAAADWTGPGTGVSGAAMDKKIEVVRTGVERHADGAADGLEILARLGGHELAAITGAVLAARIGQVPVILDGFACTVAASVLYALDRSALDHCVVGHLSTEPGHRRLLQAIDKEPILEMQMRLGEGSGAVLALGVLRAAVACHLGMASFDDAGVSTA